MRKTNDEILNNEGLTQTECGQTCHATIGTENAVELLADGRLKCDVEHIGRAASYVAKEVKPLTPARNDERRHGKRPLVDDGAVFASD